MPIQIRDGILKKPDKFGNANCVLVNKILFDDDITKILLNLFKEFKKNLLEIKVGKEHIEKLEFKSIYNGKKKI